MPEIRTKTQFNPHFRPAFAVNPLYYKAPPDAFPLVTYDVVNSFVDGVQAVTPVVFMSIDAQGHLYSQSGMDECPSPIPPQFEFVSVVAYQYEIDYPRNHFTRKIIGTGPTLPTGRRDSLRVVLDTEFSESVLGSLLYNFVALYIPRWQYPDDSIVEGRPVPFGVSWATDTGIAIGAVETFPPKTGTEIASIAFGIPYPTDAVCFAWDGVPVTGPEWIDTWLGANTWAAFAGRINPIGAARVGGVWRDVYPLRFENGVLLRPLGPIAGGWPYERVPIGYEVVPNPSDYNAGIERNFENTPPFTAYYASLVNPTGGAFWNVWKGPKGQAQAGAIGYLIHRDTPQWGTEALNPPEGETWFLYDHSWSL